MEEPPSDSQCSSDEPSFDSLTRTPSDSGNSSDEASRAEQARTPTGTPVGVDDPYEHVDRCDHCTDDGRCRFAFERFEADPAFARERRDDGYRCPVVPEERSDADGPSGDDWQDWADCPNFASTTDGKECRRCGLEERRMAHSDDRALIEEHHLSYADAGADPDRGPSGSTEASDAVAPSELDLADAFAATDAIDVAVGDAAAGEGSAESGNATDRAESEQPAHEITVALCRWCHAKVHKSWARVDDDVSPDPEAIAAREERRSEELAEASFRTAAERYDTEDA